MLKKAGIPWVIIGHSERRNTPHLKESDSFLAEKTVIALETGLSVIFCIGETKAQKDKGEKVRDEVLAVQLGAVGDALKDKVHLWRCAMYTVTFK
jgi:triosephosphate isomerase